MRSRKEIEKELKNSDDNMAQGSTGELLRLLIEVNLDTREILKKRAEELEEE